MDPRTEPAPADPVLEIRTYWGASLLDVSSFKPGRKTVWLGTDDRQADVAVPGAHLGTERIPLARTLGDDLRLTIPFDAACRLDLADGTSGALDELGDRVLAGLDPEHAGCRVLSLPDGATARLELGQLTLQLRVADKPRGLVSKLLDRIDPVYPNALLITAVFCAALIATIQLRPAQVAASEERLGRVPDRYVQFLLERTQPEPLPLALKAELTARPDEDGGPEPAEKLMGREGKAGSPEAAVTHRRIAIRGKAEDDQRRVQGTGLVAALNNGAGGLPGTGEPAVGSDLMSAIGGLEGALPGADHGVLGWGLDGDGPGGGGNSKTVGTVDLRTHGTYSGQPEYGTVRRPSKKVKESQVTIREGELTMIGPLSMEAIRAVIARHRAQIRYCYNKELTLAPDLGGKVVLRFTIEERGYIASVVDTLNTTDSANLARCMRDRVRTWRFPAPRGGGTVVVNYPFLFTPPKG